MKLEILPSAVADLARGFDFYEKQQPGLGRYFRESLLTDIDTLIVHGGIHRKIFGTHRLLARIFPFAVYYSVESDTVRIKAILDCRRDPRWVKTKLT